MLSAIDLATLEFGEPRWLWLLAIPAGLLLTWLWRLATYRRDARRLTHERQSPIRPRFPIVGDSLFWLCAIGVIAALLVALARPQIVTSLVRSGGVDIVVLLDGSASMHVPDVEGNRWQRSVRFLRTFGDALSWRDDRVALTLFAHIAAPQIRLTRDPNTFFFFLDHLDVISPFPLEDDTTWDTNIELGLYWGMRVIDKDTELRGEPSTNATAFVLLSDGQAWSGEIEVSLATAVERGLPVFVVGVGTVAGGIIPDPSAGDRGASPILSRLDRNSLRQISTTSTGQYFEIGQNTDVDIANEIIGLTRARSLVTLTEPRMEELYWRFLLIAAILAIGGMVFLRDRSELVLQLAGGTLAITSLSALLL
jgi:Ca-activated chloride channel family protein